jgi:Fe-S oxidoreductase
MIENAIDITERCRHCLMCRHVCPVGNITRMETLTPHGWSQLVALERRGLSTWNAETVDALYKCADCGSCRTHSVYDSPLPEGIAAARAVVAEQGLAPAVVYELGERIRRWENPYTALLPDEASGTGEAALFVGDEAHFLRPGLLTAALALLRAVGVEPVLVGRGRNTGYLPSSLGLPVSPATWRWRTWRSSGPPARAASSSSLPETSSPSARCTTSGWGSSCRRRSRSWRSSPSWPASWPRGSCA